MTDIYAQSRTITDLKDCYFYHTMDLPDLGRVVGNWNLLDNLPAYLGNVDFAGKRVLDVGCASGVLSFYMERQGASVVSFDLDQRGDWDMVPFAKWEHFEHIAKERKQIINRLNNAYWLAHRLSKSTAKVVYGRVYDIPVAIGAVDVVVYGSILLHLRDPFLALQSGLRLARERVIVAEPLRERPEQRGGTCLGFRPDAKTIEPKDTWWDIPPEWTVQALSVLGFEDTTVNYHSQTYNGNPERLERLYTVVGRRTHGVVEPDL